MDITAFLAQVLGVYITVAGVSGLLYPERTKEALREIRKSYLLPYFDGALALIFGLIVVLVHNVWTGFAASLITLIGWLGIAEGLAMFLLPQETLGNIARYFEKKTAITAWSAIALVLGAYLAYVGFFVM